MPRPSLLLMMAGASALAAVANAAGLAQTVGATRLGTSIEQDLGARNAADARRRRALDMREQATRAAEQRLRSALEAQQKQDAAAASAPPASAEGEQYDELARIYQAMKPAKAAVVFEQLALDVQMKVAQRMRERSTAMILAAMTPKGAATLSMALARRKVPAPAAAAAAARR